MSKLLERPNIKLKIEKIDGNDINSVMEGLQGTRGNISSNVPIEEKNTIVASENTLLNRLMNEKYNKPIPKPSNVKSIVNVPIKDYKVPSNIDAFLEKLDNLFNKNKYTKKITLNYAILKNKLYNLLIDLPYIKHEGRSYYKQETFINYTKNDIPINSHDTQHVIFLEILKNINEQNFKDRIGEFQKLMDDKNQEKLFSLIMQGNDNKYKIKLIEILKPKATAGGKMYTFKKQNKSKQTKSNKTKSNKTKSKQTKSKQTKSKQTKSKQNKTNKVR